MATQTIKHDALVERTPFYYGWVVWIIAAVGLMATSPGQSYSVSLFFDHFISDFGLDRTTVSALYSGGTFVAALSLTFVGQLIDRLGNRRVGALISVVFAIVLVLMSFVTGPFMLFIGFVSIRGLGQGAMQLVNSTVIAQWFVRRHGRMMSVALVLFSLFTGAYVVLLQRLLEVIHWRQAWIILGVGVAVTILPLTLFLMRNRPEDFGLQPDGQAKLTKRQQNAVIDEDNWTLSEAMRTPAFWIFVYARFLPPCWITGLVLHQISVFAELGYPPNVAAETFATASIFTAIMSISGGFLVDRLPASVVSALISAALVVMTWLAMSMTTPALLIVYAISVGLVNGMGGVFDGAVWANYFGRLHQGKIRGFATTVLVGGAALGPILFGWSLDSTGSYDFALWVGVIASVIAAILSLFARKPKYTGTHKFS